MQAKRRSWKPFYAAREIPAPVWTGKAYAFLANFNDVFISIGLFLLTIGLGIGSGMLFIGTGSAILILLPVLVVLWIFLEYFAGRRRLLLPSMTLSVMLTGLAMLLVALAATGLGDVQSAEDTLSQRSFAVAFDFGRWSSIGALAMSLAIYLRFRLPFALFLFAVAAAIGLYNWALVSGEFGQIISGGASFIIGLITLGAAILFDARDPDRKRLASDNAFWLHFAAAPQIMLGLRWLVTGGGLADSSRVNAAEAGILLAALLGFALLSLALNRRALIAAALLSFWLALGVLVESAGGGELATVVWTLLLLGGGIVLLGAGWKTARQLVLAFAPKTGIFARIFPPEPA